MQGCTHAELSVVHSMAYVASWVARTPHVASTRLAVSECGEFKAFKNRNGKFVYHERVQARNIECRAQSTSDIW